MAAVVTKTVSKSTGSSNGSFGHSTVTGIEMCGNGVSLYK